MQLTVQRRLASQVLNISPKRVSFDPVRLADIKEAITKADIRGLINQGAIRSVKPKGISKARTRKIKIQKSKGLRKGPGSRKGGPNARNPRKQAWITHIRVQRDFLQQLKEKNHLDTPTFGDLYGKAKGGFFRSKRHIKLYLEEHNLVVRRDKHEGSK